MLWDVSSVKTSPHWKWRCGKYKTYTTCEISFFQGMKKVGEQKSGQGAVDVYKSKLPCIDSLKCIKGPPAAIKTTGNQTYKNKVYILFYIYTHYHHNYINHAK